MSRLRSVSPSTRIEELRDGQTFPVVLYTKLGRNGTRRLRLSDQAGNPIDLTGKVLQVVVKTSPDALDTELDANFPITATNVSAGNGEFDVELALVNFVDPQSRVIVVIYDSSGANPVILAQATTSIRKAGV